MNLFDLTVLSGLIQKHRRIKDHEHEHATQQVSVVDVELDGGDHRGLQLIISLEQDFIFFKIIDGLLRSWINLRLRLLVASVLNHGALIVLLDKQYFFVLLWLDIKRLPIFIRR
jgi:hypothetical protein